MGPYLATRIRDIRIAIAIPATRVLLDRRIARYARLARSNPPVDRRAAVLALTNLQTLSISKKVCQSPATVNGLVQPGTITTWDHASLAKLGRTLCKAPRHVQCVRMDPTQLLIQVHVLPALKGLSLSLGSGHVL